MDDRTLILKIVVILTVGIVFLCSIVNYEQNCHYKDMANLGYEQTTITGHQGWVWQKVK